MKTKAPKAKACKGCKAKFVPARAMQSCCGPLCALDVARQVREKKARQEALEDRRETETKLDTMKGIPQLVREAQQAFNMAIRERDRAAGYPCISSGAALDWSGNQVDCGHFRSVGSAPALRFTWDNAHAQRKYDNLYLSGNHVQYRIGLIARIGLERVEALENDNAVHKWTREELIEIKAKYAALARELKKERG